MLSSSSHRQSLHAPSTTALRRAGIFLGAAGLAVGLAAGASADGRGSSSPAARSTTTTSRPAPQPAMGRYRDFGHARGSTGRPVAQPPLVPTLSGLHPPGFTVRPYGSTPAPSHGGFVPGGGHHHPPQVIYVPVSYGYGPPPPQDPVIVVEAPPPVVVVVPQPGVDTGAQSSTFRPAIPPPPPSPAPPTSTAPGRLRITIQPADAEVFLDDRLLTSIGDTAGGLGVAAAPGIHVLEITHPEHDAERLVFAVDPEQTVAIAIDLRETKPRRRTRID